MPEWHILTHSADSASQMTQESDNHVLLWHAASAGENNKHAISSLDHVEIVVVTSMV